LGATRQRRPLEQTHCDTMFTVGASAISTHSSPHQRPAARRRNAR